MTEYILEVAERHWLTEQTFEIRFVRPPGFEYLPGQKVGFVDGTLRRDYTMLGPVTADHLSFCVRLVPGGRFSPRLAAARRGDRFAVTAPFGFFTFAPSSRQAVWVATGTGIAPFTAFARDGARGFDLLHGVRSHRGLYYREELAGAARCYRPCISGSLPDDYDGPAHFQGRVGDGLLAGWPPGDYDFYLCGRGEMIRDLLDIIDSRYEGAHVHTERFY